MVAQPRPRIVFDEIEAMAAAAEAGLGIALLPTSQVLPQLERGRLVRLLPGFWEDAGPLQVYFSSQRQLPQKTRRFVDALVAWCRQERLAERFRADR